MHDEPREKLRELIARYGVSLCDDQRRCQGLLSDVCGDRKLELNLLVSALRAGIPAKLQTSQAGEPPAMLRARLVAEMQTSLGHSEEAATWAVDSWGLALGMSIAPPARSRSRRSESVCAEPARSQPRPKRQEKQEKEAAPSEVRIVDRRVSSAEAERKTAKPGNGGEAPAGARTTAAVASSSTTATPARGGTQTGIVRPPQPAPVAPPPPAAVETTAKSGSFGWLIVCAVVAIAGWGIYSYQRQPPKPGDTAATRPPTSQPGLKTPTVQQQQTALVTAASISGARIAPDSSDILIHCAFTLSSSAPPTVPVFHARVIARFYTSDGSPMLAQSDQYTDFENRQAAVWNFAEMPRPPTASFADFVLRIPNSALARGAGHFAIVSIEDHAGGGHTLAQIRTATFSNP